MFFTFWAQIRVHIKSKIADFELLKKKSKFFVKNSNTGLQTEWENGLVWLFRPLYIVLVFWADFGHPSAEH